MTGDAVGLMSRGAVRASGVPEDQFARLVGPQKGAERRLAQRSLTSDKYVPPSEKQPVIQFGASYLRRLGSGGFLTYDPKKRKAPERRLAQR